MLARILKDPRTERVVLGLIIFNAVTLGLETSPSVMARHGALLHALDRAVLTVFVVVLTARIYAVAEKPVTSVIFLASTKSFT